MLSFRLGLSDGVSVVAAHWARALQDLGFDMVTVAGEGPVDHVVPGLAMAATEPPSAGEVVDAIAGADLVVVENLLSIPLNVPAALVVADVLRGRPTICHHHDPPWQRERFAHITTLPIDDPAWRHVTINRLTERQFIERGVEATTIYNGFDVHPAPGRRSATRQRLGIDTGAGAGDSGGSPAGGPTPLGDETLLVAHPVRAIERKNVPQAVAVTTHLGGVYWLPGEAEEGYGPTLDRILTNATCAVRRQPVDGVDITMDDLYAACDLVVFPSTWEGFGNPPVEAAIARRPVAVADYPVAGELRRIGFRWPDAGQAEAVAAALADPDALDGDLQRNRELAIEHFSLAAMGHGIEELLDRAGWKP